MKDESTTWWWTDHLGTVGAALCWHQRLKTNSTSKKHSNRLEQTSSAQWDRELAQLQQHGFTILGYHAARLPAQYCTKTVGEAHNTPAGQACSFHPPCTSEGRVSAAGGEQANHLDLKSDGRVTGADGEETDYLHLNEGGPPHAILRSDDTAEPSCARIFGHPPGLADHAG